MFYIVIRRWNKEFVFMLFVLVVLLYGLEGIYLFNLDSLEVFGI